MVRAWPGDAPAALQRPDPRWVESGALPLSASARQSPHSGPVVPRHVVQSLGHGWSRADLAGPLPDAAGIRYLGRRAARRGSVNAADLVERQALQLDLRG